MARNFYYGSDASMVSGSANFSSILNADWEALGLTEEQALQYAQVDAELQSAYREANTPTTRTPVAVSRKNAALKAMQRSAKPLGICILRNPLVSDAQIVSLRLLPRVSRRRRNAPDTAPLVRVLDVRGRVVKVRVCDVDSVNRRSKAFGATAAEVFAYVGEESPGNERDYKLACVATRTTATITFPDSVPNGATVWLSARWVTARGENSIASEPIQFTLQGGDVVAAATGLKAAA